MLYPFTMVLVGTAEIQGQIQDLERELEETRSRLDQDSSSFSSLESQVAELRQRLAETNESLQHQESLLEAKRTALAEAQRLERLEAFDEDLERYRTARRTVSQAANEFLAELDAYDGEVIRLRKLVDEMRDAFGPDERVAKVEEALAEEHDALRSTWESVIGATKWRFVETREEATSAESLNGDDLFEDLQQRAAEGRAARILDYFNKG